MLRLGDGTERRHARMQAGLERVWPYVGELFDASWVAPVLIEHGVAVDPRPSNRLAGLPARRPRRGDARGAGPVLQRPGGGRRGIHTEAMGYLLAEMQYLHRSHPGARW